MCLGEFNLDNYLKILARDSAEEGEARGLERGLQRGRLEGVECGLQRGRLEGVECGLQRGRLEGLEKLEKERSATIKKMFKNDMSIPAIAQILDLSLEYVEETVHTS